MPYKTLANPRRVVAPIVATTQDSKSNQEEPQGAIRHDGEKPMSGVATPTKDSIYSADERRDAIRHNAGKQISSVTTPTQDSKLRKEAAARHMTRCRQTDSERHEAYIATLTQDASEDETRDSM